MLSNPTSMGPSRRAELVALARASLMIGLCAVIRDEGRCVGLRQTGGPPGDLGGFAALGRFLKSATAGELGGAGCLACSRPTIPGTPEADKADQHHRPGRRLRDGNRTQGRIDRHVRPARERLICRTEQRSGVSARRRAR